MDGAEISALENFFLSIYRTIETYIDKNFANGNNRDQYGASQHNRRNIKISDYHSRQTRSFAAIPLFDM
jgi:hypothetical protein